MANETRSEALSEIEFMQALVENVEQPGFGPQRGAAVARAVRECVGLALDLDDREAVLRACDWMVQRAENAEKVDDERRAKRKSTSESVAADVAADAASNGDGDAAAALDGLDEASKATADA